MLSARDTEIWKHARATGVALITKDEDFVTMRAFNTDGPPIVWVRLGNTTNKALLAHFVSSLPLIVSALERGETIVVVSDVS